MNITTQTAHTDLTSAKAVTRRTKPVLKARDTSLQSFVMVMAHQAYKAERKRLTKRRPNGTVFTPAYSAKALGEHMSAAWEYVRKLQIKNAWESGVAKGVAIDEATFQSCRTDGVARAAA